MLHYRINTHTAIGQHTHITQGENKMKSIALRIRAFFTQVVAGIIAVRQLQAQHLIRRHHRV